MVGWGGVWYHNGKCVRMFVWFGLSMVTSVTSMTNLANVSVFLIRSPSLRLHYEAPSRHEHIETLMVVLVLVMVVVLVLVMVVVMMAVMGWR